MVAGDTKRIIVIKNISSNLIEEAILILRSEPENQDCNVPGRQTQSKINTRNDFILKEAESIINQYIRDNGLTISRNRSHKNSWKIPRANISVNTLINIFLIAAIVFLILVVGRIL